MGLRGTVPSAGTDQRCAGADHLPVPEGEGGAGGRGDGALGVQEFEESQEFGSKSSSVEAKSFIADGS